MKALSPARLRVGVVQPLRVAPVAVNAGFPSPAQGYYHGPIDLNEHMITNPDATYILTASGESMTGAGINDGDKILADRSLTARAGDIVIAELDGELTIKRLAVERGRAVLRSENESYPSIPISENSELTAWGVVIWSLHRVS